MDSFTLSYALSSDEFNDLLNKIDSNELGEKDKEIVSEMLRGYQKLIRDLVSGKISSAKIKKEISKLLKEHGKTIADIIENDDKQDLPDKQCKCPTNDTANNGGDEQASTQPRQGEGQASQNVDPTIPDETNSSVKESDEDTDAIGRKKPDPETRDQHGRTAANNIDHAIDVFHGIGNLNAGESCPLCFTGKVYQYRPGIILVMDALPPIAPERHTIEKLRCNACQEIFSSVSGDELTKDAIGRFSPEAVASLGCYRYGYGMPFYRLEALESQFGVTISDSSMWDAVKRGAEALAPLFSLYLNKGAEGDVVYGDDAGARVVQHTMGIKAEKKAAELAGKNPDKVRSGVHTTCFVIDTGQGDLVIYSTGLHHTGEAFSDLMTKRTTGDPLVFMSDASSCNNVATLARELESEILAVNCLQHARDRFVSQKRNFPEYSEVILDLISQVFAQDCVAVEAGMDPATRLAHHQKYSTPLMARLKAYCQSLFDDRKVEPNSDLGAAIKYLFNQWVGLTGFLSFENAPLHNNSAELSLKTPKRHLKNSLAYLSERGAHVGDLYMSLIVTARKYDIEPFLYLSQCLKYREELAVVPEAFLPWNFQETVKRLGDADRRPSYGFGCANLPDFSHSHEVTWKESDDAVM